MRMARDTAASREKEKMIKSVLGGDSTMPSLEKMLSKAVFAGLLKKYEANCEIDDRPSGSLVYVVRGSIRVTNSTRPPVVLYRLRPGEMYVEHQFLSGASTFSLESLQVLQIGLFILFCFVLFVCLLRVLSLTRSDCSRGLWVLLMCC
jgi:hypothetical protein